MKTIPRRVPKLAIFVALLFGAAALPASAQNTAFTFQGRLSAGGGMANGAYDMKFGLYASNSGGSTVGGIVATNNFPITNGFFTATLDFGNVFDGTSYWLEISVRTNGDPTGFTTLGPRQALTPQPYALHALSSATSTGPVADNQLSTNVALLNGSPHFTGTVTASGFNGDGAGLTNVTSTTTITNLVFATNNSGTAVLRGNNGSDFASLATARANLGGIKYLYGSGDSYSLLSNTPPDFFGQIALAQDGGSWPYLAQSISAPDHLSPFLGSNWCGSFRFTDVCQWGSPSEMVRNDIGNLYSMHINGFPGQDPASAAKDVLLLQNEQTNSRSAAVFNFAVSNNYMPGSSGLELGVGNGGSGPWEVPATSNAAFLVALGSTPFNICMQHRAASGPYPSMLTAFFDGLTTDFHYLANNGSNALWLRASDGSVQTDGNLNVRGAVTAGSNLVIGSTNVPPSGVALDVESTSSGILPPRMTRSQRNAISSPPAGLLIYQTDLGNNGLRFYDGTNWNRLATTVD